MREVWLSYDEVRGQGDTRLEELIGTRSQSMSWTPVTDVACIEPIRQIMHVPKNFLQKIPREIVISCFSKRNDWFDSKQNEKRKIILFPEMHSLCNSYAVPFGINPNEILCDLKQNADRLK